MIYLQLLGEFLKIGMFTFGGAYGAIPLIQQSVLGQGWMDEAMFANIIAVSESTPGPIMVNAATYVGNLQGGVPGAAIATLGVVLPSFVVILLVSTLFQKALKHRAVKGILRGVKPCIMGVILATGSYMAFSTVIGSVQAISLDLTAVLILVLLLAAFLLYKRLLKKELSPILLIVFPPCLAFYYIDARKTPPRYAGWCFHY